MDHAIISDPLNVDLTAFTQPTELRDPTGSLLGVFTPAARSNINVPFTLEELNEAAAEPGGRTLDEIWRSLGVK
jgi:hypothetical protein